MCELTELCEGCVECAELLKANDCVLLSLGTFVHVLSEHSVFVSCFFCTLTECRKKAVTTN